MDASLTVGQRTKQLVLKTAIHLVAKHGFDTVSFQIIAKKCRLSQSAVMRYFPSRRKLIEGMVLSIVEHNRTLVSASRNPRHNAYDSLLQHFSQNLSWAHQFPEEATVILLLYYYASYDKDFRSLYRKILQGARGRIAECLLAGKRENLFFYTENTDSLATTLHDLLLGSILNWVATGSSVNEKAQIEKRWESVLHSCLHYDQSI